MSMGRVMFSIAVSVGTRLNAWKTNPMRSRRILVSSLSPSLVRSASPMYTSPDVASSSAARQCMSVDLPDPDGPMMAVNWPGRNSTVTPSRAATWVSPDPYTLRRLMAWAAAMLCWVDVVADVALVDIVSLLAQRDVLTFLTVGDASSEIFRVEPGFLPILTR